MFQEINNLYSRLHQLEINYWLTRDLFSMPWWVILLTNAVLFALLLFLIDRTRIIQIFLAFMVCFTIDGSFDDIGKFFGWWNYQHQLIVFTARFNAANFALVPASVALAYQFFRTWGKFLISQLLISAVYAFIGLPVFAWLGIITLSNWSYFGSFLVLILTGILTKAVTDWIVSAKREPHAHDDKNREFTFSSTRKKQGAR
ncbi:hypothetical protein LJK88_23035 [Paenibacillus sp. P26]|nr:hypothetical protein LJK88_23035 [Paenibacillus sp. P26]UUZ95596.1 hypothetical protein LJK87_14825 [Paenibacillus sp. P25]